MLLAQTTVINIIIIETKRRVDAILFFSLKLKLITSFFVGYNLTATQFQRILFYIHMCRICDYLNTHDDVKTCKQIVFNYINRSWHHIENVENRTIPEKNHESAQT